MTWKQSLLAAAITLVLAAVVLGVFIPHASARAKRLTLRRRRTTESPAARDGLDATAAELHRRSRQPRLSALLGRDGRYSTSKTIAALWTLVIAFVWVALIVLAPSDWDAPLKQFDSSYVALLGGPFAALVLAKAAVSYRVATESIQKPRATAPRLSDLVANDAGQGDLFDGQFVLFNLIAMVFVVRVFLDAPASGFPALPTALALLTGGPAAVYVANKAIGSNAVTIFNTTPPVVAVGDPFTIIGQNFAPAGQAGGNGNGQPNSSAPKPTVSVGAVAAEVTDWSDTSITATLPKPPGKGERAWGVTVVSTAGQRAFRDGLLTIDQPRSNGNGRRT